MISFEKITVEQFTRQHWQKKPLLVRHALGSAEAQNIISVADLLALSQNGACEARLICRNPISRHPAWTLAHGPFDQFPKSGLWTVLVQGVDTQNSNVQQLMNQFRFPGDALLDDVMISYAVEGAGVGPHVDSYDVFLLQLHGQRRWKISSPSNTHTSFQEGLPVKILETFSPTKEWILEAGDMLYLPAGWAHDGIAEGVNPCVTASIGYRAPNRTEWLNGFLTDLSEDLDEILPQQLKRYQSATKEISTTPGRLSEDLLDQVTLWCEALFGPLNTAQRTSQRTPHRALLRRAHEFTGRYLTEPKSSTVFSPPKRLVSIEKFEAKVARYGMRLSLPTRCQYIEKPSLFFINGESFNLSKAQLKALALLADEKKLTAAQCIHLDNDVMESLHEWHNCGWIEVNR
jgi:50S ribosomal protein L16 3-hydroxylase